MKRTLKGTYKEKKPIGCYPISNSAELLFYEPDFEDGINGCDYVVGFINGSIDNPGNKFSRHKVCYTLSGRPYINKLSQKIYLSDVMKLDWY